MKDYLILHRRSQRCEAKNFKRDDKSWMLSEVGIAKDNGRGITLSKPALSTIPIFYAYTNEIFIASSNWLTVCDLLRDHGSLPQFNPAYAYNYLKFQSPFTDETFCKGIFYLRNGENVNIDFKGKRTISLQPFKPQLDLPPPDIDSMLKKKLADIDCKNSIFHISSGLDSSILVILATKIYPRTSINVATLRTRGRGVSDEVEIVSRLSEDLNLNLYVFDFMNFDIFSAGRELMEVLGYPVAHSSHLTRFLLDRQIRDITDTVITGRGPDEYLGGYAWHGPDFAAANKHYERVCVTSDKVLRKVFQDEVSLTYRSQIRQCNNFWNHKTILSLRDRLQYDLWTIFETWNIIDGAFASGLGLNIINPFLQIDITKRLLDLPDQFRIKDNKCKYFLRETFKKYYPKYILESSKRGIRLDLQPYLADFSYREIIKNIFEESNFAKRYLNKKGCEFLVRNTLDNTKNFGWQIWSLYLCSVAYDFLKQRNK